MNKEKLIEKTVCDGCGGESLLSNDNEPTCISCAGDTCIECGECDCECTCCEKHHVEDCEVCDNEKN